MNIAETIKSPKDLNNEELAIYIVNLFHRMIMHYAMWFAEIKHQIGMEKALEIMDKATSRSVKIQMDRLSTTLGFEIKNDMPAVLVNMPRETLLSLMESVSVNWLVNDGVWFQAIEF